MNIALVKNQHIEGLQKAANIIPAKTGAAYLRSLWLQADTGTISITATDANIEIRGTYTAIVNEPGLVGVQGRAFVDLMRQLPDNGTITLTTDEENKSLLLQQGRRKYKLPINDPAWFQNLEPFPTDNAVAWSGDFLQDILERVTFCINDDDAMDAIACLYFKPCGNGRIEVCGLNGHQFALVGFTHPELEALLPPEGILIQKKYLADLKKWLGTDGIEVNITDKRLYIRTINGAEMLSLPRVAYQYPDYNMFLSRLEGDVSVLTVNRLEALEALRRITIFCAENGSGCVYMQLSEQEVVLTASAQNIGSATESLAVTYSGDISRIAFPAAKLMEIMGHFVSENVTLQFAGAEAPCGIRGEDDPEYLVIIMPMKLGDMTYYSEEDV